MYCTSNGQIPGQICKSSRSWSVTECKMPKMRRGCIWFIDLNSLVRGKQIQTFWFFWNQSDPKSSTVLSNVSLSVGAPVRVYLHSLVRRLLYSHLTPSTLSSPSLSPVLSPPVHSHPDSPSPPTTSLHGWLCLVLRSMHVCCLPWQTPQIESLFSLPPWATEARRHPDSLPSETSTPAEEVIVEAGRAQCTNTHMHRLNQCILCYDAEDKRWFGIPSCTKQKKYTYR